MRSLVDTSSAKHYIPAQDDFSSREPQRRPDERRGQQDPRARRCAAALPLPTPAEARAIHAAPGLDYDQMMVIADPRTAGALAYVPIYNNDGSLSGACGNGTRCVADRLARETGQAAFQVETERGLIACERLGDGTYRVDMGEPRFDWREIPLAHEVESVDAVEVRLDGAPGLGAGERRQHGQPACGVFRRRRRRRRVGKAGAAPRDHPLFPEKVNVSFAEVVAPDQIRLRVWERGVGVTLACGSAACATLVAAARRGLTGREGAGQAAGRRTGHRLARERRPCADDRSRRVRAAHRRFARRFSRG